MEVESMGISDLRLAGCGKIRVLRPSLPCDMLPETHRADEDTIIRKGITNQIKNSKNKNVEVNHI